MSTRTSARVATIGLVTLLLGPSLLLLSASADHGDAVAVPGGLPTGIRGAAVVHVPTVTPDCPEGCLYVFGGQDADGLRASIVRYDPTTNASTTLAAVLPNATRGLAAAWTGSKVLLFGGETGSRTEPATGDILSFDPATGATTKLAADARVAYGGMAAVYHDGDVFLFGGCAGFSCEQGVRVWDVAAQSLSDVATQAALPEAAHGLAAARAGDSIYLAGGMQGGEAIGRFGSILRFDAASRTFDLEPVGTLGTPVSYANAFWDAGQLFVVGGEGELGAVDLVQRHDPVHPQLSPNASLLLAPVFAAGGASDGDHAWIVGGARSGQAGDALVADVVRLQLTPRLLDASINGTLLTLTFDRNVSADWNVWPPAEVTLNGIAVEATRVWESGAVATLEVLQGAGSGDRVVVTLPQGAYVDAHQHPARGASVVATVLTPRHELPSSRIAPGAAWDGGEVVVLAGRAYTYCDGGCSDRTLLAYDPVSGLVRTVAIVPGSCCGEAVSAGTAVFFHNGTGILRYEADEIAPFATLPTTRQSAAFAFDGNALYAFGGHDGSPHDEIYRIAMNGSVTQVGALPRPLHGASAVHDPASGLVYVVGGEGLDGEAPVLLDDVVAFDPATGVATLLPVALPEARGFGDAFWDGGSIVFVGGNSDVGTHANATRVFPDRGEALRLPDAASLTMPRESFAIAWTGEKAIAVGGGSWMLATPSFNTEIICVCYESYYQWQPAMRLDAFAYDATPPIPEVALDPDTPDGLGGWYATPVSATYTASDDVAVASVVGSGPSLLAESATLWARAVDSSGNVANVSRSVLVDTVAPAATASGDLGELAGPNATIRFAFSEPMDRSSTEAALANATGWSRAWSDDSTQLTLTHHDVPVGGHVVELGTGARDAHGVPLSSAASRSVARPAPPQAPVDAPAPAPAPLPAPPSAPQALAVRYEGANATLAWDAPAVSGDAAVTGYRVLVDGRVAGETAGRAFTTGALARGATHTFSVSAVSAAGEGPAATTSAPLAPLSTLDAPSAGPSGWHASAPTLTLAADPADATILIDLGPGETTYAGPFALPDGVTTVRWRAVAGGIGEPARSQTFQVDLHAPAIGAASVDVLDGVLVVRASVTDARSGVAGMRAIVDGRETPMAREADGSYRASVAHAGAASVDVVATDAAGHEARAFAGAVEAPVAAPTPPTPDALPGDAPVDPVPSSDAGFPLEPASQEQGATPTPAPAAPEAPAPAIVILLPEDADVSIDAGARGVVTIRLDGVRDLAGTYIVVLDEDGGETILSEGQLETTWDTTASDDGYHTIEARRRAPVPAEGQLAIAAAGDTTLASARVLVRNPVAAATVATAVVGGALVAVAAHAGLGAVAGASSSASGSAAAGFDPLGFAQEVAVDAGQDKLRDKTKETAALDRKRRVRSWLAAAVSLALLAGLWALAEAEAWTVADWLVALPIVGAAAALVTLMKYASESAIAWTTHARPRVRLWVAGAISLAVSALVFRNPFGYPGYVDEVGESEAKSTWRRQGLRALATVAGAAAFMLPFLALAPFAPWQLVSVGILIAVTNVATSAMPFGPLPGRDVWRWSKLGAVALALAGFGLYVAFAAALLPLWVFGAVGAAGAIGYAATLLHFRRTLGPRPPQAKAIPVAVRVPVVDKDAETKAKLEKRR